MISARVAKDLSHSVGVMFNDKSELSLVLKTILVAATRGDSTVTLFIHEPETFESLLFLNYITGRNDDGTVTISWAAGHQKRNNARNEIGVIFDEIVDNLAHEGVEATTEDRKYFVDAIMELGK